MLRTLFSALLIGLVIPQEEAEKPAPYLPQIAAASDEAELAIETFKLPPGFTCELIAAEPLLANPVCFWPAVDGSFYVAESFRVGSGVIDIRDHRARIDQDLACQTVGDRVAMLKRWAGDDFVQKYTKEHERIRRLHDSNGDGRLDQAQVFADGFSEPATGLGAGLLEHQGSVYYACIPNLWKLSDTDQDGLADEREVLSSGYGVRVSLLGHDLHGLQLGPDGWLYFSCGDRGFNVELESGRLLSANAGAVLRCRLDGSELEIIHSGLCNPQELAFDHLGNLFTADSPALPGEPARWVQIIHGADSGWRSNYRWMENSSAESLWQAEKLGALAFEGQASYLLPPLVLLRAQPAGLAYYPGSGTGFADQFFLCNFHGDRDSSGIQSLVLKPKGASFELQQRSEFIGRVQASDVDFAPDGSMCFSDWVGGRGNSGKGRLYRVLPHATTDTPGVQELANLLAEGASLLTLDALEVLLGHADVRARRLAQFELVRRGSEGWERFQRVLRNAPDSLASLHCVWGMGMAALSDATLLEYLHPFLRDSNPHVRAQTARVLGDHRYAPASPNLISALEDPVPTVRLAAAIACGRLGQSRAVEALVQLAANDAGLDATLRHAASWGLSRCSDAEQLTTLGGHDSLQVRLCALVALRLQGSERVVEFLEDSDPRVALEAARAITDLEIVSGLSKLASYITRDSVKDPLMLRRILAANLHLGGEEQAEALAEFAVDAARPETLRRDAIMMLAHWQKPSNRDYTLGLSADFRSRDPRLAHSLLQGFIADNILTAPDVVLQSWIRGVAQFTFDAKEKVLSTTLEDINRDSKTRIAALHWFRVHAPEQLPELLGAVLSDMDADVRGAGLRILLSTDEAWTMPLFESILKAGNTTECRLVYAALSANPTIDAQRTLLLAFDRFNQGKLPPELHLELIEALDQLESNATRLRIEKLQANRVKQDPVTAKWVDTLWGGNAATGRELFEQHASLACTRCHLENSPGTENVGPELRGVGKRLSRLQLLESILAPNRLIAPEFESVLFVMKSGELIPGRVLGTSDEGIRVLQASGEVRLLDQDQIAEQKPDLSAMPQGLELFIKPREMRDLIEYMSTL